MTTKSKESKSKIVVTPLSLYKDFIAFVDFERQFLSDLAARDELDQPSLTYEKLFEICEQIAPSTVLGSGGAYFEMYLLRFGTRAHVTSLLEIFKMENPTIDSSFYEELIKRYALPYWFELITKIIYFNRKANTQLFLYTLSLEYRGLSRLGIQWLAFCGAATNIRTFDRKRNIQLGDYDNLLIRFIRNGRVVFAIDNYSHIFWCPKLKADKRSSAIGTNCTVGAMSVPLITVDNSFKRNGDGDIIPALPPKKEILALYLEEFIDSLKHAMCDIKDKTGHFYTYHPISTVVKHDINTVPARPPKVETKSRKDVDGDDEMMQCDDSHGLKQFRPWFVTADNPSSNFGTANVITRIFKELRELLGSKYAYLRFDVDLFQKWLRVTPSFIP